MSWSGTCRALGLAAVSLYGALAFTPLPNVLYRSRAAWPSPAPAAAIVALGSGVAEDGTLSARSLRRLLHGVRLYRQGLAPLIVLLGPSYRGGPEEAVVRAALVRELGVPPPAILADSGGRTTQEEAKRTWSLLQPRGARRILLVTGSHHMSRARGLFTRAGFEVVPAPVEEVSGTADRPADRIGLARILVEELSARLYYRIAGYL